MMKIKAIIIAGSRFFPVCIRISGISGIIAHLLWKRKMKSF